MKILLTGMTRMQANRPRRRDYNTSINAFYQALLASKHEVDWRMLEYDEKGLDKYDLLILGLGTISEFSCNHLYETLLATKYNNVLYLVNDWKANATVRILRDNNIFRDFVLKNNTGNRLDKKKVLKDAKRIEDCRDKMFRRRDNLVGPFFSWGDRRIIIDNTPFERIYEFNPTAFYLNHWKSRISTCKTRTKRWVYGALADYSKWHKKLGAKWPILSFTKKTFIPENELIQKYSESYGMLMPKYKASGSGWWRARYCHAVLCKNVIYSDLSELAGTKMWEDISIIETKSTKQLDDFAAYQSMVIKRAAPSWKTVIEIVDDIVSKAAK